MKFVKGDMKHQTTELATTFSIGRYDFNRKPGALPIAQQMIKELLV